MDLGGSLSGWLIAEPCNEGVWRGGETEAEDELILRAHCSKMFRGTSWAAMRGAAGTRADT